MWHHIIPGSSQSERQTFSIDVGCQGSQRSMIKDTNEAGTRGTASRRDKRDGISVLDGGHFKAMCLLL